MARRVVNVTDEASFGLIPPCADPRFDHRTCDYWEDADRGQKASRPPWLRPAAETPPEPRRPVTGNPFLDEAPDDVVMNPFAPARAATPNPFLDERPDSFADNPFAPPAPSRPVVPSSAPRKLQLLSRGLGVFGSYAKVLLVDDVAVAWSQFGPLSAYPRAMRVRELYPQLPDAPLPAVITCIASTAQARRQGFAQELVQDVCDDLADRGFAAVEAYPERNLPEDATSAALPAFWERVGFTVAVDDERFPVVRREL